MIDYNDIMHGICSQFENLSKQVRTVKQRLDDGEYDDNPVVEVAVDATRHVSNVVDDVMGAGRRLKNGYDGLDVWNLGDRLVLRLATLIDESIAIGSCYSLGESVDVGELHEISNAFKAYALSDGGGDFLWCMTTFKKKGGKKLLDNVYDATKEQFLIAWKRFAELYLIGDIAPSDTKPTLVRTASLRLAGKPDASNLREARIVELRRMVAMLREFCEGSYGYPYGYDQEDSEYETLLKHKDGWEDGPIPLAVQFWGNKDVIGKDVKTVKDMDKGYVAYICDIIEVTDVLDAWADWLDGELHGFDAEVPTYATMDTLRHSGNDDLFQEVAGRLRKNFTETWSWFGTTVMTVWV